MLKAHLDAEDGAFAEMQKIGYRERSVAADFLPPAGHLHFVARSPSVVGPRASGISRISDSLALFRIIPKASTKRLDECPCIPGLKLANSPENPGSFFD